MKTFNKYLIAQMVFAMQVSSAMASDSYRYLHVSIDTPWVIFIFLLFIVLFPFVLSAILYWYFTFKKNKESEKKQSDVKSSIEEN